MKKILLLVFFCINIAIVYGQKKAELTSPDGNIKVEVSITDKICYTILSDNETLIQDNVLALHLKNEVFGQDPKLSGKKKTKVNEILTPLVPLKYAILQNDYNQLILNFKGNYSVEFRAFDDGVAYRFVTNIKQNIEILNLNEYLL